MGTQKNRLNETVLLSTQNICLSGQVRKYLQFYAQKFCYLCGLVMIVHVYFQFIPAADGDKGGMGY